MTHTNEYDVNDLADLIVVAVKAAGAEDENNDRGRVSERSNVAKFCKGIWNQPHTPLGYQKKGEWIEKAPGWDPVITEMFALYIRYKKYLEVAYWVNKLHGEFLKKQIGHYLTRQQVTSMLQNTIYKGCPQLSGKIVEKNYEEADRTREDPDLAYVKKDVFDKVPMLIKAEKGKSRSPEGVVKTTS